jgi:hypothetical protein
MDKRRRIVGALSEKIVFIITHFREISAAKLTGRSNQGEVNEAIMETAGSFFSEHSCHQPNAKGGEHVLLSV